MRSPNQFDLTFKPKKINANKKLWLGVHTQSTRLLASALTLAQSVGINLQIPEGQYFCEYYG